MAEENPTPKVPKPPTSRRPAMWAWMVMGGLIFVLLLVSNQLVPHKKVTSIQYSGTSTSFIAMVDAGKVKSTTYEPSTGKIAGTLKESYKGSKIFRTNGPLQDLPDRVQKLLQEKQSEVCLQKGQL